MKQAPIYTKPLLFSVRKHAFYMVRDRTECVYTSPILLLSARVRLGHEAENDAILLYRKIIEEAFKCGDTTTRLMFEEIVAQEEERYWKFDDFLK